MRKKILSLLCATTMIAGACTGFMACGEKDNREKLVIWVSETAGVASMTSQQVNKFFAQNTTEEYKNYNVIVRGMTESEAATQMVSDVKTGADIYCFAQDQMGRLIEANALSKLNDAGAKFVSDNNDAGSVLASKVGNDTYCYPITSDNTYFMYYDTRVVSEDHIGDLASIVADCKAAGKNFSFELGGSAWYTASFFFGAGCTSSWSLNAETKKWTASDNFNSANGLIALEGMQILTKSGIWNDSSKASDFTAAKPSAVVVSGTWDSGTARKALSEDPGGQDDPGDGKFLGVAKLPSYTVNDQAYQLRGFSGFKLMGVKPQTNAIKASLCHDLAQFLSNEQCQLERFKQFGWGPSNKAAQQNEEVLADPILKAVGEASAVGIPQGQIHGGWWDFAKLLGSKSQSADATAAARQEILDEYAADIAKYENMTEEDMAAFGIIGSLKRYSAPEEGDDWEQIPAPPLAAGQTSWSSWGADIAMTASADGLTWTSPAVTLTAGDAFKVRQGQAWTVAYGGGTIENNDGNYIVAESEAGVKKIQLVLTKDNDGNIQSGVVSLISAE